MMEHWRWTREETWEIAAAVRAGWQLRRRSDDEERDGLQGKGEGRVKATCQVIEAS